MLAHLFSALAINRLISLQQDIAHLHVQREARGCPDIFFFFFSSSGGWGKIKL